MTNTLYAGAANPNGNQVGNVGDEYNQIINGVFVRKWIKASGNGTTDGWV